jgi:hypothetical protein
MQIRDLISWETSEGPVLQLGDRTVTPVAQALRLRTPLGGLVWNRPVAVVVAEGDDITRHPIVDVTRIALWAMAGASILSVIIVALAQRRDLKET